MGVVKGQGCACDWSVSLSIIQKRACPRTDSRPGAVPTHRTWRPAMKQENPFRLHKRFLRAAFERIVSLWRSWEHVRGLKTEQVLITPFIFFWHLESGRWHRKPVSAHRRPVFFPYPFSFSICWLVGDFFGVWFYWLILFWSRHVFAKTVLEAGRVRIRVVKTQAWGSFVMLVWTSVFESGSKLRVSWQVIINAT